MGRVLPQKDLACFWAFHLDTPVERADMRQEFDSMEEEDTAALAESVARHLVAGQFLALSGDLGSGKTTFTRGLTRALGCTRLATSPTYSLIQAYKGGRVPVLHCDLYRLNSEYELEDLGWHELLDEYALPADRLEMTWSYCEDERRALALEALGARSVQLLERLRADWSQR